jgi:hypothetical protein
VLGTVVGETLGYLLTATWTVLIISALGSRLAGHWFSMLGYGAAALIAVGVLVPLHVPGTDFANFVGYILWSIWMLAADTLIAVIGHRNRRALPVVTGAGVMALANGALATR